MEIEGALIVFLVAALLVLFVVYRTAVVVPQQSAFVVERLGRYHATMNAGFHILFPFVDVIRYRHTLKETAHDIAAQVCITRDNVQVGVDGILYLKVLNPERASYGISDYLFAITQLAQTTLRSEVGKIDLDRTFEERSTINKSSRRRKRIASSRSTKPKGRRRRSWPWPPRRRKASGGSRRPSAPRAGWKLFSCGWRSSTWSSSATSQSRRPR